MTAVTSRPKPQTLADALEALHQRESELRRASQQLADARRELEDTNRGIIALHTELESGRHAAARLAAIVESSDNAIISMTPDCVIQTWNVGAQRLLGHPEARIVGEPIDTLLAPESREDFATLLKRLRSGEHAQPYDTRWRRADGALLDVAVTVSALRDTRGELVGFSAVAQDITEWLVTQAELAATQAESEVLAERDRVARDLHDTVIQRIFGAGLALQSTIPLVRYAPVADRLKTVIGDLDNTIKELRGAIFDLHQTPQRATNLRARLFDLVNSAERGLGFVPTISFAGTIDAVPDPMATHVLAVVQEALSNIIRHAHASAAEVALDVDTDLVVEVNDNGLGLGPTPRASGLTNMRERAETFGGSFQITSKPGAGTQLRWRVPLAPPPPTGRRRYPC